MKRLIIALTALCALLVPSSSNARVIEIELYREWKDSMGLTHTSAVIDTTDFRAAPGDTIVAIVPYWSWLKEYYGQINFQTTNGDSMIIPPGVTVLTNAFWKFLTPIRIGEPGGQPVKFIATGLRHWITPDTRGGTIDRRAGIGVTKSLVAYNLTIAGFNGSDGSIRESYGAIQVAYGANVMLCDSRTEKNRVGISIPFTDSDLPKTGEVTIKTIRHSFADSLAYLSYDADRGVTYTDETSSFGSASMGIRFSQMPFNNPAETNTYLEKYGHYTVTLRGSTMPEPLNKTLVQSLTLPGDRQAIVDMVNAVIKARVIINKAPSALAADFNGDGVVGFTDFFLFVEAFNKPATGQWAEFNLNADAMVDFADFFIFVENWGKTAAGKMAIALISQSDLDRLLGIAKARPELLPAIEYLVPRSLYGNFYSQLENRLPNEFKLAQNFPNPFNPATTITYSIPQDGEVKLVIYSLTGQVVRTLVDNQQTAGSYSLAWNATDDSGHRVASGVYFYQLTAGSRVETRHMILIK